MGTYSFYKLKLFSLKLSPFLTTRNVVLTGKTYGINRLENTCISQCIIVDSDNLTANF